MAYIGSTPTSQNFISGTDYFNGTGSQTAFTLTRTVNSVNDIEVVINNVVQQPSTAYTISGTTITFTSAPSSGTSNIYVRYLTTTTQTITPAQGTVNRNTLDSNLQAVCTGRNRIINGAMTIAQRGTSTSLTTGVTGYSVDRFGCYVVTSGATATVSQSSTAPVGFASSLLYTVGTGATLGATDFNSIFHRIEGYNMADLNWGSVNAKTITISFWVRSSVTGTFGVTLRNSDASRGYGATYTINTANTWEQKTITIAGDQSGTWDTTNGIGLNLTWGLGVGSTYSGAAGSWGTGYWGVTGATNIVGTSGATFYVTGVQLEEGTQATSFEREIYSVTLQKCQRYYQKVPLSLGAPVDPTLLLVVYQYPVIMRAVPTVALLTSTPYAEVPFVAGFTASGATVQSHTYVGATDIKVSGFTGLTTYRAPMWLDNNQASLSAEL